MGLVDTEIPLEILIGVGDVPGRVVDAVEVEGVMHHDDMMLGGGLRGESFQKRPEPRLLGQVGTGHGGVEPGKSDILVNECPLRRAKITREQPEPFGGHVKADVVTIGPATWPAGVFVAYVHITRDDVPSSRSVKGRNGRIGAPQMVIVGMGETPGLHQSKISNAFE